MTNMDKEKLAIWIQGYLSLVEEAGLDVHTSHDEKAGDWVEGYKFVEVENFQKNFDIDAKNLAEMLDIAIGDSNLVSGNHYLPKRMLLTLANEYEGNVRKILRDLFDEEESVSSRIDVAHDVLRDLLNRYNTERSSREINYFKLHFISLLLSFHNPEKYNAIKPAEWKEFYRFVDDSYEDPGRKLAGEQYRIYSEQIDALREELKNEKEIEDIRQKMVNGLDFQDAELRWMAQTVIYVGSIKFKPQEERASTEPESESVTEDLEGPDSDPNTKEIEVPDSTDDFKSEHALEVHIAQHWKSIPFFAGYEIQKGSAPHGGQYHAEGKLIDLLAYSPEKKSWLVIELKKRGSHDSFKVVGQVQTYMGFVKKSLAKEGETVRGLIITGEYDKSIDNAVSVTDNLAWLVYTVKAKYTDFKLHDPVGQPKTIDDLFAE